MNCKWFVGIAMIAGFALNTAAAEVPWVRYDGAEGPGQGKTIVIVTGDDEYRSEEGMPQLGKILSQHHGFDVIVLFAIDPETGEIKPDQQNNIPGLELLEYADLMVLFTRFRQLPDEDTAHIAEYLASGRPIMALRTSTHAFNYPEDSDSEYAHWGWRSKDWTGGFGRQVLGETWINHYGVHNVESTRGLVAEGKEDHPIVRGVEDIWGPSDVYGITTLHGDSDPVIMGQVLVGMNPDDAPNEDKELVPVAWTKTFTNDNGKVNDIFTTTMGHAGDLKSEGFRRLLVNAAYWLLGMEDEIPAKANVELIGEFDPTPIGFGNYKQGVRPRDHRLK